VSIRIMALAGTLLAATLPTGAEDIAGVAEHPMVTRYPGQHIRWQTIEKFRPFRVPLGPVTGFREIGAWADLEGRVTRTFCARAGTDRG
jgi:OOP family OmpA-OmpF porin